MAYDNCTTSLITALLDRYTVITTESGIEKKTQY